MKKTSMENTIFNKHRIRIGKFALILMIGFSLLFVSCGDSSSGDNNEGNVNVNSGKSDSSETTPAGNTVNLSDEEKSEIVKGVLYTSFAGIGYTEDQTNAPLYNVMINDLNLLAATLAVKALLSQGSRSLLQSEELVDNSNESIDSIDNEDFASKITAVIDVIKGDASNNLKSKLSEYAVSLIGEWLAKIATGVEDQTPISYEDESVSVKIDLTGLENLLSESSGVISLILTADFNDSGFPLKSSTECIYTGIEGDIDFQARIDINVSYEGLRRITVYTQAVELIADDSLTASYASDNEVQYNNWIISYGIDLDNYFNIYLIPVIKYLIPSVEGYEDDRDYTLSGGFSLNDGIYETTGIHYTQFQDDDNTSTISIAGDFRVPAAEIFADVSAARIIRSSNPEDAWVGGQMDITIEEDTTNVIFNRDGSATIGDETISVWQESLNPLN